jgi:hopene-associated glycosyltransferase HpnB
MREGLEAGTAADDDLRRVTVLIPARDEAPLIGGTIAALHAQGRDLEIVVVDDQSTDGTSAAAARAASGSHVALRVVSGAPLPPGWAGKLWALEQGFATVARPFVLLLDADIELAPRLVPSLLQAADARQASLVSLMAKLHCATFWERLLAPAFVFFFKLLYPFARSNDAARRTAAAAGGCMLVRTDALRAIGGFAAIRGALIDDCTLAAALKEARPPIWIGVSQSVQSSRVYARLGDFWSMVSRSAFTQLKYSLVLLLLTTVAMTATLLAPVAGVVLAAAPAAPPALLAIAAAAWLAMSATYWPTIRYYGLPPCWALMLPLAGALFLAMTWTSAASYWHGTRATWKNRAYDSTG